MTLESGQIGVLIERPVSAVYDCASDPADLPEWAPGLGSAVVEEDGSRYVETPAGILVAADLARLRQVLERAAAE